MGTPPILGLLQFIVPSKRSREFDSPPNGQNVTQIRSGTPAAALDDKFRRRMAARIVAQILKKSGQSSIAFGQRSRPKMNRINDRHVFADDSHFELGDESQK